jgi:GDPmannose 4,6-dehydratase
MGSMERIEHLLLRIELVQGDMLDQASLVAPSNRPSPEGAHFADENQVAKTCEIRTEGLQPGRDELRATSRNQPVLTGEFTGLGVTSTLAAVSQVDRSILRYQVSSSVGASDVDAYGQRRSPRRPHRRPPVVACRLLVGAVVRGALLDSCAASMSPKVRR